MATTNTQTYETLCETARAAVRCTTVAAFADAARQPDAITLDVREPNEWNDGILPNAHTMPRGVLEKEISGLCPDCTTPILVYCATGKRSALAALTLKTMGYGNVLSLQGGFDAWSNAQQPIAPCPCVIRSSAEATDTIDPNDWASIRASFAITARTVTVLNGEERSLVYLDHAATTHPPDHVLARYEHFLRNEYANVHRASYQLARQSTLRFEDAYRECASFVGADLDHQCVVFLANTTAACDLVAHAVAERPGKVLVTNLEHHSNDLPFRRRSEVLRVGLDDNTRLDMTALREILKRERIKLVTVTGAANVTGWMPPIHEIARLAHDAGALICVDAAQLLAHAPINMGAPGDASSIDFLVAAGHKAYAPMGTGFLIGPRDVLDSVEPIVAGGGVAAHVDETTATWLPSPDRHQFGTPNVAGAIALAEMLKLLRSIGMDRVRTHELGLYRRMVDGLKAIGSIERYGPDAIDERVGIVPFNVEGVSDMLCAAVLGEEHAVAVRNGRFCSHVHSHALLHARGDAAGAVRASIGLYNNEADIDRFLEAVECVQRRTWDGSYSERGGVLSGSAGGRCADTWMESDDA
jgi:cysteine desulfurase/selenocysteine lyase